MYVYLIPTVFLYIYNFLRYKIHYPACIISPRSFLRDLKLYHNLIGGGKQSE